IRSRSWVAVVLAVGNEGRLQFCARARIGVKIAREITAKRISISLLNLLKFELTVVIIFSFSLIAIIRQVDLQSIFSDFKFGLETREKVCDLPVTPDRMSGSVILQLAGA